MLFRSQPHGKGHSGSLPPDTARDRHGRERPRAGQGPPQPPSASFTRRLHARPKDGHGPEEILERDRSALATRLRAAAAPRRTETVELQVWGTGHKFSGSIVIERREVAIITATQHRKGGTVWTDGSRLDKRVGAAFV